MTEQTIETQLLSRIALRDRRAFQEFYRLTSPRVFPLALKMLNNRVQAEDLMQEVYLKVWYSAESFNATRGGAMSWLFSITRNRAIDVLRARDRSSESAHLSEAVENVALPSEVDGKLQECLDRLEVSQRQSIFAAFFQGLTHSEMAERFAQPIGTVKSHVRRGLFALRGCLES